MTLNKKQSKQMDVEQVLQGLLEDFDIDLVGKVARRVLGLSFDEEQRKKLPPLTFEDALIKYYGSGRFTGLSKSTQDSYKTELQLLANHIKLHFPKGADTLFTDIIFPTKFLVEYLQQHKTQSTRNKKTAIIRSLINTVLRDFFEENKEDFQNSLKLNWETNTVPKGYSLEQIEELLILSKKSPFGLRNYTILCVFLGMGIRVDELVKIQIKDIDLDGYVSVRPKRRKHMLCPTPIHDNALKVLLSYISFIYGHLAENWDELKSKYGEYYIFANFDDPEKPMTTRGVEKVIKKLVMQAKSISKEEAEKFSCHNFRHSFAQFGIRSGINLSAMANLLNHTGLSSVLIYSNQTKEQIREDMKRHVLASFQVDYLNKGGITGE